jgi:hypothetical protein
VLASGRVCAMGLRPPIDMHTGWIGFHTQVGIGGGLFGLRRRPLTGSTGGGEIDMKMENDI